MKNHFEFLLDEKKIVVKTGEIAQQSSGSVVVCFGDTTVLTTVCCLPKTKNVDFFPLVVNYEEKFYADCRIPNVFNKREGKASEREILVSRLIDRSIRPLFKTGFRNEVQVINIVMSYDRNFSPEIAALLGTSLALNLSDIPFDSIITGVFVGKVNNNFIINPNSEEKKNSSINIFVVGDENNINMIEADAAEVDASEMLEALKFGHEAIKKICQFQKDIIKNGKAKRNFDFYTIDEKLKKEIYQEINQDISEAVRITDKIQSRNKLDDIKNTIFKKYENNNFESEEKKNKFFLMLQSVFDSLVSDEVRNMILKDRIRPDGRKIDEIRELNADIGVLPKVHGSAMFSRGQTQVMTVTTLSTLDEKQYIDNLSDETERFFMHQYNFHPFSVCEISNISIGRREIGHGKLGEKALKHVIPDIDVFPFTIRSVSEVLSSNGSSSQASICASSLSLINAGVPIKNIVAGIAVGLITKDNFDVNNIKKDDYVFLTDIQDLEDHYGDMDFKLACTRKGIVALQMDLKINAITINMLSEAINIAKESCFKIISVLEKTLNKEDYINKNSLKVKVLNVLPEKIRDIIGVNGKNINNIVKQCDNCEILIKDDKNVYIYHNNIDVINKAINLIENIVDEKNAIKIGDKIEAEIVRIEKFGVIVKLSDNVTALCHISQLDNKHVSNIFDNYHVGDKLSVVVTEIDKKTNKIRVSHKELV
ncbi:MAG: polyribonucleotide nucleotidyltransferase [Bacilli bacterium]|nr:polyribonucleotide nucleotidyltransferase [Bacilli bacterium]